MNVTEGDFFVAFALFRATIIPYSPWLNTVPTEQTLTPTAFSWISNHKGTDCTNEELGLFFLFLVTVKLFDVKMVAIALFGFVIWFWDVAKSIWIFLI